MQTISFAKGQLPGTTGGPLSSRTSEGLDVAIEVSFQYALQPEELYNLYMEYGVHQYKGVLIRVAQDALTDVATHFTAFEFFSSRSNISMAMDIALKSSFERLGVTVDATQLKDVDLPNDFEQSIVDTQSAQQEKAKA